MVLKVHKKNKITLTTRGKSLLTNKVLTKGLKKKTSFNLKGSIQV
jgi:hypothetical protein